MSVDSSDPASDYDVVMKRITTPFTVILGIFLVVNVVRAQQGVTPTVTVVRDPGCGCCLGWVAHMQKAGFKTTVSESAQRKQNTPEIPASARSCHTTTIDGYLVEGHVPVEDIKRLLRERPKILGIAAPGMPAGSPGMEVPSGQVTPYDVVAFDKTGKVTVFASHR
jgi:hypothetical protein